MIEPLWPKLASKAFRGKVVENFKKSTFCNDCLFQYHINILFLAAPDVVHHFTNISSNSIRHIRYLWKLWGLATNISKGSHNRGEMKMVFEVVKES